MDSSPIFPTFKKLELSDKQKIERFTHGFLPYSDFNFTSLWNYNIENIFEWTTLHGNLVVKFADYVTDELFLSFMGKHKITDTIHELLKHAHEYGLAKHLKLIPEEVIHMADDIKDHFTIEEDPDNHDYILSIKEYLTYSGNKFASKRRNLKKFTELFPDATVEMLDISKESVQKDIVDIFLKWSEMKKLTQEEVKHELAATKRFIENSMHFDHISLGIRHKGTLIAYSLLEKGEQKHLHNHFMKSLSNYRGLFEKMDHEVTKYAHQHGFTHINIQQDLGIEGLRIAKRLGRPSRFLKKYRISHKE